MDGCLYFVGVDGRRRQTLVAHSRPVSVLRSSGERVVSGGYDGMVVVHRLSDLEREAAVTIHNGNNVTSLALDTVSEGFIQDFLLGVGEGEKFVGHCHSAPQGRCVAQPSRLVSLSPSPQEL